MYSKLGDQSQRLRTRIDQTHKPAKGLAGLKQPPVKRWQGQ